MTKHKDKFVKYCRYVPLFITLTLIICCIVFVLNHDFNELLAYTPDNVWLAALVILGFFVLKSLSVVIPLAALFVFSS